MNPATKIPVTTAGVYEHTDGTFARYAWDNGRVRCGTAYASREALHAAEDAERDALLGAGTVARELAEERAELDRWTAEQAAVTGP